MKLYIKKEYEKKFEEDRYYLATYMLNLQSVHLFVAANSWEEIELELDDSIPDGVLRTFALSGAPIKVSIPESVTGRTVTLLCELYPDKSGSIRKAYITGAPIKEVIAECII